MSPLQDLGLTAVLCALCIWVFVAWVRERAERRRWQELAASKLDAARLLRETQALTAERDLAVERLETLNRYVSAIANRRGGMA